MQNTTEKSSRSAEGLYKFFIYFVLVLLAVTIIVPVAWVFMASIKQNAEFYGNPWALPAGFYWQNFVNAWNGAKMGEYMLNSVIVTALALALLLVVALPAAYCLSRFHFKGCKVLNTLFMAGLFINVNYIVVPIFLMLRDSDAWLLPRLISGQSLGCYPINRAIQNDEPWQPMEENTIADSISVGVPRNADKALMAIRESNGIAVNVSDEEILAAQRLLGRTCGLFGEPAGVTGAAALKKACEEGLIPHDATVVSVVTGNGLKDVANAIKSAGEPILPTHF